MIFKRDSGALPAPGTDNVSTVTLSLGYESLSSFSPALKRNMAATLSQYRHRAVNARWEDVPLQNPGDRLALC